MVINGVCTRVEQYMAVDAAITNTLYVNWTINAVVLVMASFRAIKLKWRKCMYNR